MPQNHPDSYRPLTVRLTNMDGSIEEREVAIAEILDARHDWWISLTSPTAFSPEEIFVRAEPKKSLEQGEDYARLIVRPGAVNLLSIALETK